jgi:hypothetical protein
MPHTDMTLYTEEEVREALEGASGVVSRAADDLGCDRETVYRYMERWPDLHKVRDRARRQRRQGRVMRSEDAIDDAIAAGEAWAIRYALSCLAKDEGWIERITDVVAAGNLDALRRILERLGVEGVTDDRLIEAALEVKTEMDAER